jgi:DNA-binding NarL/FixJ family response regulator
MNHLSCCAVQRRASGFAPGTRESVSRMAHTCCLAGIDHALLPMFNDVCEDAGISDSATVARLDVSELGRLGPDLLVCDVDGLDVDPLELLRRIRFVLPDCVIAVYTGVLERAWGRSCHLAGANCLLSKESNERQLAEGVRGALRSGCYTAPYFTA